MKIFVYQVDLNRILAGSILAVENIFSASSSNRCHKHQECFDEKFVIIFKQN